MEMSVNKHIYIYIFMPTHTCVCVLKFRHLLSQLVQDAVHQQYHKLSICH